MSIHCKKFFHSSCLKLQKNPHVALKTGSPTNFQIQAEFRFANALRELFGKWLYVIYPEDFGNVPSAKNAACIRCLLAPLQTFQEAHRHV